MRRMTLESCLNFMKDTFGEKIFEKPRFQILFAKFSDAGTLHSSVYQEPLINLDCFHNNDNISKYPELNNTNSFHTVFSFDDIIDGYILFIVSQNRFETHRFAAFLLRKQDCCHYPIHLPISNPLSLSNELVLEIKKRYVEFLVVMKVNNSQHFADIVFDKMFLSSGNLISEVALSNIASVNFENNIVQELNDKKVIDFVNQFRLVKKYKASESELYRIVYNKDRVKYDELFNSIDQYIYGDKYIIAKDYKSLPLLSKSPFKHKFNSDIDFYNNDNGDNKLVESVFSGLFCLKTKQKTTSINLIAIHNKLYLVADGIIDVKNKVDELLGDVKRAEYFALSNSVNKKLNQHITDSMRRKTELENEIATLMHKISQKEDDIRRHTQHLNISSELLIQKLNVEFCEEVI